MRGSGCFGTIADASAGPYKVKISRILGGDENYGWDVGVISPNSGETLTADSILTFENPVREEARENLKGHCSIAEYPPGRGPSPGYQEDPPSATISPESGDVDTLVRVNGEFSICSEVQITFDGQQVATARPDSSGEFSISFRVPPLPAGNYTIRAGSISENFTITG